jgi:hypothetical protein
VEALWHSIVNVGIVIAAFVVAVWCALDKKYVLGSILLFCGGAGMYGLHIYSGFADGICEFANPSSAWDYIVAAEDCIDSYSPDIISAQIGIIAAMLVWLSMAWRKVFRKLELEEEVKQNKT